MDIHAIHCLVATAFEALRTASTVVLCPLVKKIVVYLLLSRTIAPRIRRLHDRTTRIIQICSTLRVPTAP